MTRLSGRLVVASHNAGKVREISELLAPLGLEAVSAGALGLPEPEETEATFTGNAELKARAAAKGAALPALAERANDGDGLHSPELSGWVDTVLRTHPATKRIP